MSLLVISATAMCFTAIAHSGVGEKRLIGPLLALNLELLSGYRANLVRFSWHFTSLLMITSATIVAWPATSTTLVRWIGSMWLFAGVADAVLTRGRHVGWPLLSAAGLSALLGA